jgi:hypothetical protein
MLAMQDINPGRVVAVAPQFVADVLDCLDDMIGADVAVPDELDVAVQQTVQSIINSTNSSSQLNNVFEILRLKILKKVDLNYVANTLPIINFSHIFPTPLYSRLNTLVKQRLIPFILTVFFFFGNHLSVVKEKS